VRNETSSNKGFADNSTYDSKRYIPAVCFLETVNGEYKKPW